MLYGEQTALAILCVSPFQKPFNYSPTTEDAIGGLKPPKALSMEERRKGNEMIDFLTISTRSKKRGVIEIYPKFIIKKSGDLMIRGGDFCSSGHLKI